MKISFDLGNNGCDRPRGLGCRSTVVIRTFSSSQFLLNLIISVLRHVKAA